MVRDAVALIELVIAIVVIGFVLLSVPMVLTASAQSNILSIRQEEIMATKTKVASILTMQWDESAIVGTEDATYSVHTNSPSALLTCHDNNGTFRRIGHIQADDRRYCFEDKNATTIDRDAGDGLVFDDIDDYDGSVETLTPSATAVSALEGDYIFEYNITSRVRYLDDNFSYGDPVLNVDIDLTTGVTAPTTNIKMIEVSTSRTDGGGVPITLRAFSSNIGDYTIRTKPAP